MVCLSIDPSWELLGFFFNIENYLIPIIPFANEYKRLMNSPFSLQKNNIKTEKIAHNGFFAFADLF